MSVTREQFEKAKADGIAAGNGQVQEKKVNPYIGGPPVLARAWREGWLQTLQQRTAERKLARLADQAPPIGDTD